MHVVDAARMVHYQKEYVCIRARINHVKMSNTKLTKDCEENINTITITRE